MTTSVADYIAVMRNANTAPRPRARRKPGLIPGWEEWLTFALVVVVFLSVVNSIEDAEWVPQMPSILAPSMVALLAGFLLGRTKLHEVFAHLLAIAAGFGVVLLQLIEFSRGETFGERWVDLKVRIADFVLVVRDNGISTDNLPFVMLVLALTYLAAYFSSWAIFRWKNAWLGVIPAGVALLTNISYLPGQPATSFLFFLFGAILLVMRLHLMKQVEEWERTGTPYPPYLSISYLNATFWVSTVLLGAVWLVPVAEKSNIFNGAWERMVNPLQDRADDWGRFFAGIASKKPVGLHDFGDTLAFQGAPSLSNEEIARVIGEPPTRGDLAALRGAAYDVYTPSGWKVGDRAEVTVPAADVAPVGVATDPDNPLRKQITVEITASGDQGTILTLGQPVAASIPTKQKVNADDESDVGSVEPADDLGAGERYLATGSISTATDEQLNAIGTDYPAAITGPYLQIPDDLPQRVRDLAEELTRGKQTPYEKAQAIELYLRTVPLSTSITPPPPGSDGVDYFLFEARSGFFDYHASAMAVLLRAAGVPARVATGFVLDDFDNETGQYVLRESNTYTWPEVYFPGQGWVAFNPSPDRPAVNREDNETAPADTDGNQREPDLPTGNPGGSNRGAFVEPQDQDQVQRPIAVEEGVNPLWYVLAAIAGVLVLGTVTGRLLWERGLGKLPHAAKAWEKTIRLASWAKLGPRPAQTPREYARMVSARIPKAAPVKTIADAYTRSRWSRPGAAPADAATEEQRVEGAWKAVRLPLLAKLFRLR